MEDIPLDTSTSEYSTVQKEGFWSKGYVCTRVKLVALFVVLGILIIIIIILAALLGDARSKGSGVSNSASREANPTTSVAPTTPGTDAWWKIRLPRNVVPVHYNVFLNVTVDLPRYDGNVEIEVKVTSPTDLILIHSRGLNISHITVVKKAYRKDSIPIKRHFEFKKNEFYVIQTKSVLSPSLYVITMHYEGFFSRDLRGLYRSTFKYHNGKISKFAATQFQPVRARTAFPCLDEPALKATFNVTVAHRPDHIALSNMPIYRSESVKGQTHDYFGKTVIMPTYLLALAVGDFKYKKTVTKNNVEMRIYSRPSLLNQTSFAAIDGSKMMTFFEEYFDVKYSLPKADMIALPNFGPGAMENWGLITYKERYLLWEKTVSSEPNKITVANIISHELAHQWFGNIVTMKWWDDLWLNEGFASYLAGKGTSHAHPSWEMKDRTTWRSIYSAMQLDGLVSSHPIKVNVNSPNEINQIFDTISYRKGAAILAMLESFLGSNIFMKGLRRYIKKFSYSNAETDDLWQTLKEESCLQGSCINVKHVMDTWTLQMGYPVIKLTKQGSSKYLVTQKHFLFDKTANVSESKYKSPFNYTWVVPFSFLSKNNQDNTIHWMEKGSIFISDNSPWIKGNSGHTGFYIVNYEESNWKALKDQLNNDFTALSTNDRAGLIFDAFILASGGDIGYDTAFDITTYLKKEKKLLPWEILINRNNYLRILLSSSSIVYKKLQKYLIYQAKELYNELGFSASGHHLDIFKRRLLLRLFCSAGVLSCVNNATQKFDQWMKNPIQKIAPNLREIVLNYGVAYGGVKEWDFVYDQYQKTDIPDEKRDMIRAMASAKEPWILARYLDYALDPRKISKDKLRLLIASVADNPIGNRIAWDFVRLNWNRLNKKFGSELLVYRRLVPLIAKYFTTDYELRELEELTESFVQRTGIKISIMEQMVDEVKSNIHWIAKNAATIDKWLTKYIVDNKIQQSVR